MLRRFAPAVLTVAVTAVALTGCSTADVVEIDRADCSSPIGAGALSDSTVVLGGFGTDPEVSIPSDTQVPVSQRTIVDSSAVEPKAPLAENNTIASVNFAFYDQGTGEKLFQSGGFGGAGEGSEFFLVSDEMLNPLSAAVQCAAPGERVVLALSPEDAYPLRDQIGGTVDSAVVAVMDVEAVSDMRASGRSQGLPNGFPAVVSDENGQPGLVLPPRKAPVGSNAAVRVAGTGAEVGAESRLLVQMLAVGWDGSVLTNTWGGDGPQLLPGEAEATAQGLAFRSELTGKKVGSQVVITEGGENARVLVLDILALG